MKFKIGDVVRANQKFFETAALVGSTDLLEEEDYGTFKVVEIDQDNKWPIRVKYPSGDHGRFYEDELIIVQQARN